MLWNTIAPAFEQAKITVPSHPAKLQRELGVRRHQGGTPSFAGIYDDHRPSRSARIKAVLSGSCLTRARALMRRTRAGASEPGRSLASRS